MYICRKKMDRQDNVRIFNETVDCVNNGYYTNNRGEEIEFETKYNGLSFDEPEFYRKDIKADIKFDKLPIRNTEIKVINGDCLYVAKELVDEGLHPAVVNFASFKVPGGGVRGGSRAQEENICRRSNLFASIFRFDKYLAKEYGLKAEEDEYPLPVHHGAIYSPGVTVFRASDDKEYEFLDEPFMIDVITIAALSHPELTKERHMLDWAKDITKEKVRTMLNLALYWSNDAIVLGAFGCGAFANPPEDVAQIFKEVLDEPEYRDKFEKIVFAVLDDGNSHRAHNPRGNYLPFLETFGK